MEVKVEVRVEMEAVVCESAGRGKRAIKVYIQCVFACCRAIVLATS